MWRIHELIRKRFLMKLVLDLMMCKVIKLLVFYLFYIIMFIFLLIFLGLFLFNFFLLAIRLTFYWGIFWFFFTGAVSCFSNIRNLLLLYRQTKKGLNIIIRYIQKHLLGMRSNLRYGTTFNFFLDLNPILAIFLNSFHKSAILSYSPSSSVILSFNLAIN